MTMYTRDADGELQPIPAEHAEVLAQYRNSMPLVYEVQECGPPMLYALIDDDEFGAAGGEPSRLERLAAATVTQLRRERLGLPSDPPKYEQLVREAAHAYLADIWQLAMYVHLDGESSRETFRRRSERDLAAAARKLGKTLTRLADSVMAEDPAEAAYDRYQESLDATMQRLTFTAAPAADAA